MVVPAELKACARFSRLEAVRSGPRMVTYGLAAICNMAKPRPTTNNPPRNNGYERRAAAGQNRALPAAEMSSPMTTPFL